MRRWRVAAREGHGVGRLTQPHDGRAALDARSPTLRRPAVKWKMRFCEQAQVFRQKCLAMASVRLRIRSPVEYTTYCVEKVERQRFQEDSDVHRVRDRSIAAVLASPGRHDFFPEANVAEFFNTIDPKRTRHRCPSGVTGLGWVLKSSVRSQVLECVSMTKKS